MADRSKWYINSSGYKCELCGRRAPIVRTYSVALNEGYHWGNSVRVEHCTWCDLTQELCDRLYIAKGRWKLLRESVGSCIQGRGFGLASFREGMRQYRKLLGHHPELCIEYYR